MSIVQHLSEHFQRMAGLIGLLALLTLGNGSPCRASHTVGEDAPPAAIPVGLESEAPLPAATAIPVKIERQGGSWQLYRDDEPYFIKGIGGSRYLDVAAEAGANSVRTWGSRDAGELLSRAMEHGMTVMFGIWLSHDRADYLDSGYRSSIKNKIQDLLDNHKHHPALLMWALGNETNLRGADTPAAWQFVNELASLIKSQDPLHPVVSVIVPIAGTLDNIAEYAPNLDVVGINTYGGLPRVREIIEASAYEGPYIITEWGVNGHWEADRTEWGRPIEPTSAQKADFHLKRYEQHILANRDRCLGSYVFRWGHKQERTPTWYSMFIENVPGIDLPEVSCPTVDVMRFNWSGSWPTNQAPRVAGLTVNGIAGGALRLTPGESIVARVDAADPENDGLRYVWELLEEPTVLGSGGKPEPRPAALGDVVDGNLPQLNLVAPQKTGEYRLFVYVLDPNGNVGTANIPFQVNLFPSPEIANRETPATDG
jgi:hypothetical protein